MRFLCYHTLPTTLTIEDIRGMADRFANETEVHGIRSFMNLSKGKAVCVIDAVSKEKIEEFFRRSNIPFDDIVPVELEGEHGVMTDLRATEAVVA